MGLIADIQDDLDRGAFRLIAEYRGRLMAEAVALCKNESTAEDLVSQTIDKAIRSIGSCRSEENLFAWMKSILTNLHLDDGKRGIRRKTQLMTDEELEALVGGSEETVEKIVRDSDHDALREAIAGLDEKYRKAVSMYYFNEFSLKEIAALLNTSASTVSRRLALAQRILAAKLQTRLGKKPVAIVAALLLTLASAFGAWKAADALGWLSASEDPQIVRGGAVSAPQGEVVWGGGMGGGTVSAPQNEENAISKENKGSTDMNLKQVTKLAAVATMATALTAPTANADDIELTIDRAQQRYPWNGYVDIDYTITRDPDSVPSVDDNLEVMMIDKSVTPAVTNRAIRFLQAPLPMTAGKHRITWDANADGVTNYVERASFVMKIAHYVPAYMVIDVSGGPDAETYPVGFYNGEPVGGFSVPEYKGDKIVLRRIHPGSYMAGSPSAEDGHKDPREAQHRVTISRPFYIGLFEISQQQYLNVMGGENPSKYQGDAWQYRPVEMVSWDAIRGSVNWPNSTTVGATSFMGKLCAKCKSLDPDTRQYTVAVTGFDLPTEFQWEYACRAGTTGAFNTTNEYANTQAGQQSAMAKLGRFTNNRNDIHGNSDAHTIVGSYEPNSWGLYDMHGNVWEWCRDWYKEDVAALGQHIDPVGADTGTFRVWRGGGWDSNVESCRSARCYYQYPNKSFNTLGFRLSRALP